MATNESIVNGEDFESSLREVEALSDEELFDKLKQSGKEIGPIVATTRRLYQKQLATILTSPNGSTVRMSTATANGNAEEQNGDVSDSDDASFETSSRASRSSRGSSLPKRKSVAPTPTKVSNDDRPPVVRASEEKKRENTSLFETPNRPSRTFEEFVAESEQRKARHGDSYLRRQESQERTVEASGNNARSGILPVMLVVAVLAVAVAFAYLKYGTEIRALLEGPKDRDTIIDQEIDELSKNH